MNDTYAQSAKKAPAATRTPTMVAPMPTTLIAPLLPPLKEPVGTIVEDDLEDVVVKGIEFRVELKPVEEGDPVPEEEESDEERAASMVKLVV